MSVAMVVGAQLEDAVSIQLSCLLTLSSPEMWHGDPALEETETKPSKP